jgi:hypothetical protein
MGGICLLKMRACPKPKARGHACVIVAGIHEDLGGLFVFVIDSSLSLAGMTIPFHVMPAPAHAEHSGLSSLYKPEWLRSGGVLSGHPGVFQFVE